MMNMDNVPWCEKYRARCFDVLMDRKIYKGGWGSSITSSDVRSIFPGDLRVARCFSFGVCWRFF